MISPHTPPGTKVVALINNGNRNRGDFIVEGCIYTVEEIVEFDDPTSRHPFGARLVELNHGPFLNPIGGVWKTAVDLCDLRRLDLPSCLTDILKSAPVDSDKTLLPAE